VKPTATRHVRTRSKSEALYDLLEGEIVPAFYERRADGLPRRWIARMKSSIAMLCPEFNMHRMVKQYTNEYYLVAHNRFRELSAQNGAKAMQLAAGSAKSRSMAAPAHRLRGRERPGTGIGSVSGIVGQGVS
jgi:glucan phosphorylase